jgi:uncharacterized membrane protein YeaQ/YmgE (transglycosylase-associated protein family)
MVFTKLNLLVPYSVLVLLLIANFSMNNMSLVGWILFGFIAGAISHLIDPQPRKGGFLGAVVLGVLGALTGGFLATLVFGGGIRTLSLNAVILASFSALLLLFVGKVLRRA